MALLKEYVLEFGKYGSSIGMAAYALLSLWIFWQTDVLGQSRQWTYILLDALQALVLFCSFVPLALLRGDISLLLYFAMSYVLLLAIAHGPGLAYSYMPPLFLRNISLLLGIGLQLLASLDGFSLGGERGLLSYKSFRQWAFLLLAFVLAMGVPQLLCRLSFLRHLSHAYGLWIWISLAGVWLLGHATNGSKIRLGLGLFYFQPSEFAKLALVFLLASLLWKGRGAGWRGLLWTAVYGAGAVGLLALSRDLGTALVFYALVCGVVVMATGRWIYGVLGLLLGASASAAAYKIFSHVQIRVSAWLNPWTDVDRGGYQIAQSMFALGNGGLFGQGAGRGAAKAIPYVEADFIFSALAEEWGLLSCLALLLLFFLLYAQTHMLGRRTGDRFYSLLSMAVGLSLAFQAFLTIGGGIKFIPLTGITLPFVSYGGSSLMSSMMMAFVVAGVYQKRGEVYHGCPPQDPLPPQAYISTGIFFALFASMGIYLTHFVLTSQVAMFNHDYNARTQQIMEQNARGPILDRQGRVLAASWPQGQALPEGDLALEDLPELALGQEVLRYYPYGRAFAHSVGYQNMGRSGLEALANYYLAHSHLPFAQKAEYSSRGKKNSR